MWLAFRAGGFFPGQVGLVAAAVAIALVLRITIARRPFEGWSPALVLASGALGAFAVWILLSATWSNAPTRALSEFDRTLLYGLVLALTGSLAARTGDLATALRWVAAAFAAIAIAGLLTRLAPDEFPISAGYLPERISFPLTYWNAMGIACALGLLLGLHFSASGREHPVVRVVAAALLPPIAVTLYLTFSRGGIWVLPLGVGLYLLLAQPRGLVTAAIAAIPAGIAVKVAYGAEALARADYDTAAAAPEARRVALAVLACAGAALVLRAAGLLIDRQLERLPVPSPRLRAGITAGVVAVLAAGAVVAGVPERVDDARTRFTEGASIAPADLRDRLTSAADNGRIAHWRVARDEFEAHEWKGTGAGTYRLSWDRERPDPPFKVNDAHSLYLETLSELGIPGLALLLLALATPLLVGLRRLAGEERHAHGAFVAAGTMLAVHAAVDWDWEVPALFVWFFGAGGIVLAARAVVPGGAVAASAAPRAARLGELGRVPRIVAALAVLVLAITPVLFAYSQPPLDRAVNAFNARDCRTGIDAALTATERFGVRPEPWMVLGYCDARLGQFDLARRAMDAARSRDPDNWQIAYGQAIVYGVSGMDPRPYAEEALRLNPLDPRAQSLARELRRARTEARRAQITRRAEIPFE